MPFMRDAVFCVYVSCCHSIIHSFVQCSVIHTQHTHARAFLCPYALIYNNASEWGVVSGVRDILFWRKAIFSVICSPATNEWRKQIAKSYTVVVVTFTASFFYGPHIVIHSNSFFYVAHTNSKTAKETKPKREESSFPVSVHFAKIKSEKEKKKTRRSYRTGHLYTTENGVQCTTIK